MNTGVLNISDGNAVQTGSYFVGIFTRSNSAATGTQAITGVGFKPKSVIFFASGGSNPACSVGATDGTNDDCLANNHNETAEDWQAIPSSIRFRYSGADRQDATLQSYDSDGFTMSWVKVGSPTGETSTNGFIAFK
jgi:hypothetical protein